VNTEAQTVVHQQFTAAEKIAILRRHLLEQVPVSDLCDEHGIHLTVFNRWQKQLFENGAAAFAYHPNNAQDAASKKLTALEEKLARKNEVLSELMEEHTKLRKALGVNFRQRGRVPGGRGSAPATGHAAGAAGERAAPVLHAAHLFNTAALLLAFSGYPHGSPLPEGQYPATL
jgi:transposase